jgi:hypothetical protein
MRRGRTGSRKKNQLDWISPRTARPCQYSHSTGRQVVLAWRPGISEHPTDLFAGLADPLFLSQGDGFGIFLAIVTASRTYSFVLGIRRLERTFRKSCRVRQAQAQTGYRYPQFLRGRLTLGVQLARAMAEAQTPRGTSGYSLPRNSNRGKAFGVCRAISNGATQSEQVHSRFLGRCFGRKRRTKRKFVRRLVECRPHYAIRRMRAQRAGLRADLRRDQMRALRRGLRIGIRGHYFQWRSRYEQASARPASV